MSVHIDALDAETAVLVRLAASIAGADEAGVRSACQAARDINPVWVDELIVQSYIFCGFPRALNAAREWRRVSPAPAPLTDESDDMRSLDAWRARGAETCAAVYGELYDKLRVNIRELHPALDAAMVIEGYGKILGRPQLDLPRRELCIVAACAMTDMDRQLHSHLHGALNVGVSPRALGQLIDTVADLLGQDRTRKASLLLARVVGK